MATKRKSNPTSTEVNKDFTRDESKEIFYRVDKYGKLQVCQIRLTDTQAIIDSVADVKQGFVGAVRYGKAWRFSKEKLAYPGEEINGAIFFATEELAVATKIERLYAQIAFATTLVTELEAA